MYRVHKKIIIIKNVVINKIINCIFMSIDIGSYTKFHAGSR